MVCAGNHCHHQRLWLHCPRWSGVTSWHCLGHSLQGSTEVVLRVEPAPAVLLSWLMQLPLLGCAAAIPLLLAPPVGTPTSPSIAISRSHDWRRSDACGQRCADPGSPGVRLSGLRCCSCGTSIPHACDCPSCTSPVSRRGCPHLAFLCSQGQHLPTSGMRGRISSPTHTHPLHPQHTPAQSSSVNPVRNAPSLSVFWYSRTHQKGHAHRHTDRGSHTHADTQRHIHTYTHRGKHTHTHTHTNAITEGEKETYRTTVMQIDKHSRGQLRHCLL